MIIYIMILRSKELMLSCVGMYINFGSHNYTKHIGSYWAGDTCQKLCSVS